MSCGETLTWGDLSSAISNSRRVRQSALGLAILLASLVCLGTWPALLDLSSLHDRHPSHAYLDYATTILVVASVLALASEEPLLETSWASIALAGGGGCLLMAGNLSMQRSLLLGVPLSIVLPLQGSLCVVLGTSVNYVLQPARSDPTILFCGVAAFLAAIALSAAAHLAHEREADADGERERQRGHSTACARLLLPDAPLDSAGQQPLRRGASPVTGLVLAAAGGCCFGFFTPAFNLAVNDELGWAAAGGGRPLGVFAANGFFCLAFAASAWVVNLALMRWPPPGARRSSLTEYLHSWSRLRGRGRALGFALLAGLLCALGNAAQFLGGALAGFAAADLVQAYPLVSTLWGMGLFGEFRGASRRVWCLLAAMYSSFVAAVALLALSVR